MPMLRIFSLLALLCASLLLDGCASIAGKASQRLADSLGAGILEQDDIGIARDGIPSWLLLVDGLIHDDPDNRGLLLAGAKLYGAYAGGFVDDPARARRLSARGFGYARRAACIAEPALCSQLDAPFEAFEAEAAKATDVAGLHALASAWAGRIQADSGDWNAIAEIPKVQALLERVVALAPSHAQGEPYMMLGVLASLRPASLGGQPEQGRAHFEKALALSGGRNQMVRVLYAQYYAR
ncbi:MAG TPA: TRAP transporter TatT component family protein, partial [Dokdonella sp.]